MAGKDNRRNQGNWSDERRDKLRLPLLADGDLQNVWEDRKD